MRKQKSAFSAFQNCQFVNRNTSLLSKGPMKPAAEGNHYVYVFLNRFRKCNITVKTPSGGTSYCKHNYSQLDIKLRSFSKSKNRSRNQMSQ